MIFRGPSRIDDAKRAEADGAMAWVYILKSVSRQKTYVGSTTDLMRRLEEHNSGKHTYTKRYCPWVVVYTEEIVSLPDARAREKYLKSAAGRRFIKKNNLIPHSAVAQR